jgi:hypothetical protein
VPNGDLEAFRVGGRTLFTFGLVRDAEGNLSTFDGSTIVITRTGSMLDRLDPADLIAGPLDGPLAGASSDLEVHRRMFAQHGPGAIAHCHPPGSVPEGEARPGEHGDYAFGATIQDAVAEAVRRWREP